MEHKIYQNIKFHIDKGLATLTFNDPDKLNAISSDMSREILSALRQCQKKSPSLIRALIITGAGRAFCVGGGMDNDSADIDAGAVLVDRYNPILFELENLSIPVIAIVNGPCAGAGMSIALAADIVVAAKSAYFLQAFSKIGLSPDAGSSYWLPRLIGQARATAMMMLAEKIPAQAAEEWGMIYKAVEDSELMSFGKRLGAQLAQGPSVAVDAIRQLLKRSINSSYAEQLNEEALWQRKCANSKDAVEGVAAFIEKRQAHFKGQ